MKTVLHLLLVASLISSLCSCVNFQENITLRLDGSGEAKYQLSFSSDCPESVREKIVKDINSLRESLQPALSTALELSVSCTSSACSLKIDFSDVQDLNLLWEVYLEKYEVLNAFMPPKHYGFDQVSFSRYFNDLFLKESYEELVPFKSQPTYSSFFFFEQPVVGQTNPEASLSGNKKVSALKVNFASVKKGESIISNNIVFAVN